MLTMHIVLVCREYLIEFIGTLFMQNMLTLAVDVDLNINRGRKLGSYGVISKQETEQVNT